jgi:transcriptional regulator with XRE-family HTH domain
MTYPPYIREKARALRLEKKLTIDELAERLAISRSTIYYWVRELPIPVTLRQTKAQLAATRRMQAKFRRLRKQAYVEGRATFHELSRDPTFRDFVTLYIAEGYKRSRNRVSTSNSDPAVAKLATKWVRAFATNRVHFSVQYHADQDPEALREFWGRELGADADSIRLQRKSNSGKLTGRTWRSPYGVIAVNCDDTRLRARLQGWIDSITECWLDSLGSGV